MFVIEVELLTGRYAATAHDDRHKAEWPPHPARLFSALVAVHAETGKAADERNALLWLERQPPPSLEVSDATRRDVLDVYVPVNDISAIGDLEAPLREKLAERERLRAEGGSASERKKSDKAVEKAQQALLKALEELKKPAAKPSDKDLERAQALLPEQRTRQVRQFPVALPDSPLFAFGWPEEPPEELKAPLETLCGKLTRLGHSSSLVWCRAVSRALQPDLVPRADGDLVLRTVSAGQLDRLDRAWAQHEGVRPRVLPAMPHRYGRPIPLQPPRPHSVYQPDEWIVFERVGRPNAMASRCVDLTRALRAALLEQHGQAGLSPALSGHEPDGRPTQAPHVAFVALPSVGSDWADGSVKACAIIPPRGMSEADRQQLFRLVAEWETRRSEQGRLTLAGQGLAPVRFERVQTPSMETSQPGRWSRTSTRFATATPIALDRNPGDLRSNREQTAHRAAHEAEQTIAAACEHIGLPRPRSVQISFAPLVRGAMATRAFRPLGPKRGRPARVLVHAMIEFDEPVRGPVLLGAGRHFGLGLCLPVEVDA